MAQSVVELSSVVSKDNTHDFFRFLSLPLEIRYQIYDEILVVKPPTTAHPFYHDRHGKVADFSSINPCILVANKQINAEASSILYDKNALFINLSTPVTHSCTRGIYGDGLGMPQALLREQRPQMRFTNPGLIGPHCLQRLSHLEITVSVASMWANAKAYDYFTHIGDLLLELLQLLADDETAACSPMVERQLTLTIERRWTERFGGSLLFPRAQGGRCFRNHSSNKKGEKQLHGQMMPLLEAISKKRKLRVLEIKSTTQIRDGTGAESPTRHVVVEQRWVPIEEMGDM
ncbi:MAG: hypothetical protein Q9216_000596 [Gyalolechia sp. 2 TL-2023]